MVIEEMPQWHLLSLLRESGVDAIVITNERDLDFGNNIKSTPGIAFLEVSATHISILSGLVERCSEVNIPIIALVSKDRVVEIVEALDVNDFVVYPSDIAEIVARSKKVIRRSNFSAQSDVIRVGDLVINETNYEVSLRGRRISLRFKEYELLRLLASNTGRVFTREGLLNQVWGFDYLGGTRTVDVHIRRLRSKIEDVDHSLIESIWNVGYRYRNI